MTPLVTAEEMRRIESAFQETGDLDVLMRRAGEAVASRITRGKRVLVLAGPGNNGGDALVAAATLANRGQSVSVYGYKRERSDGVDISVHASSDPDQSKLQRLLHQSDVIVDGLLGTGRNRKVQDVLAAIITTVNGSEDKERLAIDIPTGVDADTGAVESVAFRASTTLSMGFGKRGLWSFPGADFAGQVETIDIGIPVELASGVMTTLATPRAIQAMMPHRSFDSNKGRNGTVLVMAGSRDFSGAPSLASMAAYRIGAGLVDAAVPQKVQEVLACHNLETIFTFLPRSECWLSDGDSEVIAKRLERADSFALGPGVGKHPESVQFVRTFLARHAKGQVKGVLDADGLNAVADWDHWWEQTPSQLVITPHPGEMSRLLHSSVDEVQKDRFSTAAEAAKRWKVVVVLKGAYTVIATPDGATVVNPTGAPNLATAGTGDVLTGTIAGLMAQGLAPRDAAIVGVWLHGAAGSHLSKRLGEAGTIASDLLNQLPIERARLESNYSTK